MFPASVRYTLTITIDRPIRPEEWDPKYPTHEHLETYVDEEAERQIEKEVLRALRVIDGDADGEVSDTEWLNADGEVMTADTVAPDDLSFEQKRGDY